MRDPLLPRSRASFLLRAFRAARRALAVCVVFAAGCVTADTSGPLAVTSTASPTTPVPPAGSSVDLKAYDNSLILTADGAGKGDAPGWWERINLAKPPPAPPPPAETILLRADGIVSEPTPRPGSPEELIAGARELFRQGDFKKAELLYKYIADKKKTPMAIAEEARYYEAESLRLQNRWPKAADVYADLLNKFPNSAYREQAIRHMYDIANFWLDDTRIEMMQTREKIEGRRWFVDWHFFNFFDERKPKVDEEGRAIEKLEQVRYNDINGPLADQALFLAGSVKFFNQDYKEADNYFSQIHEKHPNSPLAEKAVKLAIISKHLSTGGAEYDGRKVAEARKLVASAFDNYPELANKNKDFLTRQLIGITLQQAEKDYKMAEFWNRTGHIGAAYFYYQVVQQRYPETPFAEMARKRAEEVKIKAMKDKNAITPPLPKAEIGRPAPLPGEMAPAPRVLDNQTEVAPQPRQVPTEEAPAPRPVIQGQPGS